jgi:hypothetical protein
MCIINNIFAFVEERHEILIQQVLSIFRRGALLWLGRIG